MLLKLCRALRGILFSLLIRGVVYHGTGNGETKNAARKDARQRQEREERLLGADYVEDVVEIPPCGKTLDNNSL